MTATPDPGETFVHEDLYLYGLEWEEHGQFFAGRPVVEPGETVADPSAVAWALTNGLSGNEGEPGLERELRRLADSVGGDAIESLVLVHYGHDVPAFLAANAARLPRLRSVFLGFVSTELMEISWIEQGDVTPLLEAFPHLERLDVRGSDGLTLRPVRHERLRVLRFECGGLPAEVVRAVGACDLPALEHLEMWLGVENYGGNATVADLAPILSGERLPALRRLGLCDSPAQDAIAAAVAAASVVARLEELSLSMGELTDAGAEALLGGQPLTHLRRLDLHHHYLSGTMAARIAASLPGVDVDLSERQPDYERYVAVSE
ncbi:STM4015 family protein [Microbispora rosea]|uniref:STM4015 family protein n=1 Tax=Microbispora rosea TaxID=58117 RepID=UPI000AEA9147|nr:STM4015 family protein [Microbispora rosea]